MGYTKKMERDFIKEDLGPTLEKFGYSDVKLMMVDDNRMYVEPWADTILGDKETVEYVSGIAVHWYNENDTSPDALSSTHKKYVSINFAWRYFIILLLFSSAVNSYPLPHYSEQHSQLEISIIIILLVNVLTSLNIFLLDSIQTWILCLILNLADTVHVLLPY